MKRRIYIDACILILGSKGDGSELTKRALEALDQDAEYLYSSIVEIETIPKPAYHKFPKQLAFMVNFFSRAQRVECTHAVQTEALRLASMENLGPCDALHVACAVKGGATELITAENEKNTLPRSKAVQITTIRNSME